MVDPEVITRQQAADQKAGMTLDELGSFVQRALKAGVPGDRPVTVDMSWRSRLQKVST